MSVDWYTIYDTTTGEIVGSLTSEQENLARNVGSGCSAIAGQYSSQNGWVNVGIYTAYTDEQFAAKSLLLRPRWASVWSNAEMRWIDQRSLDQKKAAKWDEIKAERESYINSPLETPYGVFDGDEQARRNISDTVLLLNNSTVSGVNFTLADNSAVTLTRAQMFAVGSLLATKVQAAYDAGRALRAQIDAASTAQAVQDIHWSMP